jgi:DNA-binding SARP family transcriptional activator
MWLDIAVLEQAYALVQGVPGRDLGPQQAASLQSAVEVYRGDLLEGWYQDWCLDGRELLQNKYLMMLDKLIGHCLSHHLYETGQRYCAMILSYDRARERTHRQLMRLLYMSGDRTGALRQFDRCSAILNQDLGVRPDKRTQGLYTEIRQDSLQRYVAPIDEIMTTTPAGSLAEIVDTLKQLDTLLIDVQQRIVKDIKAIETGLKPFER